MKYAIRKFIGLILFMLFCADSLAQVSKDGIEMQIKKINTEYANINGDTAKFRVERKDILDQSSEGGLLEKFYEGKSLRKVILTLFGETGKSTSQYYFLNGEIIFVHDKEVRYQSPIYLGKTEIESREENRLYFTNQRLILWIGNDGKIMEADLYFEKEEEILDILKIIL